MPDQLPYGGFMKISNLFYAACFSCALIPATAQAIGSIAIDDRVGEDEPGYGISVGYATKEEAIKRALQECRKAGNTNCKMRVWFEGCGAYAASNQYFGVGWGRNQEIAEEKALQQCGNKHCEIKVSECDE